MLSLTNSLETKSNQVHEEVEVDGKVRDEEDGRPPAAVVTLHHHVRIAGRDHQIVFVVLAWCTSQMDLRTPAM